MSLPWFGGPVEPTGGTPSRIVSETSAGDVEDIVTDDVEVDYRCTCGHPLSDHPPEDAGGEDFAHRCAVDGCSCEGYQEED